MLILTPMEEIKTVVTEKHHLDNREESIVLTTFRKFWSINILLQGLVSMVFQSNPPLQEKDLSIEILIDALKPVLDEKIQLFFDMFH